MAVDTVGAGGALGNQKFRAALTDVFAGSICSILSVAYCLSYAALIFAGPLKHSLAIGVAVTFLSAAVGGMIVASRSSLPFAIAGPDSSISVVLAAMVATVVQRLAQSGADPLIPTLVALALTTVLTGLLLCILGFTHAGRAIRFVPFPVIGGFLGATGWLMITGAMQVVTDQRPMLANIGGLRRHRDHNQARRSIGRRGGPAFGTAPLQEPVRYARCSSGGVRGDLPGAAIDRCLNR